PIRSRPSTRTGNVPPPVRTRTPTASRHGPTTTAGLRWCVRKRPIGMSAAMRANPKAPATSPTCQSASAPPCASSGRIAGKAPIENVVAKIPRQRSASSGVTRPLMVNHWPMTSLATMRLEIAGALARLTLERPEVLNAGDARFARDLKAVVATLAERPEIRVALAPAAPHRSRARQGADPARRARFGAHGRALRRRAPRRGGRGVPPRVRGDARAFPGAAARERSRQQGALDACLRRRLRDV